MSSADSPKAKSRSGCRQCKVKRVSISTSSLYFDLLLTFSQLKCDESKPACQNCIRRNLLCPGYGKHLRWSQKHERFRTQQQQQQSSRPTQDEGPLLQYPQLPPTNPTTASVAYPSHQYQLQPFYVDSGITTTANHLTHETFPLPEYTYHQNPAPTACNIAAKPQPNCWQLNEFSNSHISPPSIKPCSRDTQDAENMTSKGPSTSVVDTTTSLSMDLSSRRPAEGLQFLSDSQTIEYPLKVHTSLIEYWFTEVCQMWSMFDSDANLNRNIAQNLWGSSKLVFYAMQSMSAACMVKYTPEMRKVLISATKQTLALIQKSIRSFDHEKPTGMIPFPTELLFAIFAMGTSLHWSFDFRLGRSLIYDAQRLLQYYKMRLPKLDASDRIHLKFFQQALICWESLVSAVDQAFIPTALMSRLQALQMSETSAGLDWVSRDRVNAHPLLQPQLGPQISNAGHTELHPWCGVSSDILEKFGQVLAICHTNSREKLDAGLIEGSHYNIMLARDLQSELLAMNFQASRYDQDERALACTTGDSNTPLCHLLDIAEAYRQASLLQLHLTFDSLPIPPLSSIGQNTNAIASLELRTDEESQREYLSTASVRLLELLRRLPPHSGSRCMQPVLYLCAATGLQTIHAPEFAKRSANECGSRIGDIVSAMLGDNESCGNTPKDGPWGLEQEIPQPTSSPYQLNGPAALFESSNPSLSRSTIERGQAKSLVASRLGALQHSLPPGPSSTAIKLAEAIWREHDRAGHGRNPVHWFDVMVRKNLRTLFG